MSDFDEIYDRDILAVAKDEASVRLIVEGIEQTLRAPVIKVTRKRAAKQTPEQKAKIEDVMKEFFGG